MSSSVTVKRAKSAWGDYRDPPPRNVATMSAIRRHDARSWTSLGSATLIEKDTGVRQDCYTALGPGLKFQLKKGVYVIVREKINARPSRTGFTPSCCVFRFELPRDTSSVLRLGQRDYFVTISGTGRVVNVWKWHNDDIVPRVVRRYISANPMYAILNSFITVLSFYRDTRRFFIVEKPPTADGGSYTGPMDIHLQDVVAAADAPLAVPLPLDVTTFTTMQLNTTERLHVQNNNQHGGGRGTTTIKFIRHGFLTQSNGAQQLNRWDTSIDPQHVPRVPYFIMSFANSPSGRHFAVLSQNHEIFVFVCPENTKNGIPRVISHVRANQGLMLNNRIHLVFTSELEIECSGGGPHRFLRLYHQEEQNWWMVASVWAGSRTSASITKWRAHRLEREKAREAKKYLPRAQPIMGCLPDDILSRVRSYITGSLDLPTDREAKHLRESFLAAM